MYMRDDRMLLIAAGLFTLLVVWMSMVRVSAAAFNDTTQNAADRWTAGDVVLTDDDGEAAMFAVANMKPGDTETECITVTYSGSLDAVVVVYGALVAGDGLDEYVDVTVRRGSGGTFGDCTGFSSVETVYAGTLRGFVTTHASFGSGAGTWAPVGGGADDVMTYQFEVTLQDTNVAQGLTSTVTFTWEAQNT